MIFWALDEYPTLTDDPWTPCLISTISWLNEHKLKNKMLTPIQTSLK